MRYSKEEIMAACEFGPIDDIGTLMTYKDFIDSVNCGCFIDYDGYGELVIDGHSCVVNSCTDISTMKMYFGETGSVPFYKLHEIFGDDMKILWFNR